MKAAKLRTKILSGERNREKAGLLKMESFIRASVHPLSERELNLNSEFELAKRRLIELSHCLIFSGLNFGIQA